MSGLPRIVLKWLQTLDLTYPINNPKWDLSNGFLVGEILASYYPRDVQMFCFNNGRSLNSKMLNWALIKRFITMNDLKISMELIDATMHCKEGAGTLLIEKLYELLTQKTIQKAPPNYEIDFTDWPYQRQLPYHARSTASKSIKNNLKTSELQTDPNLFLAKHKATNIIEAHMEHRLEEREKNPNRFEKKRTIAALCIRRPLEYEPNESNISNIEDFYDAKLNRTPKNLNISVNKPDSSVGVETRKPIEKEIQISQETYA